MGESERMPYCNNKMVPQLEKPSKQMFERMQREHPHRVVTGIAGSRLCSSDPADGWAWTAWSVSGRREGLKVPRKQNLRGRLWLRNPVPYYHIC